MKRKILCMVFAAVAFSCAASASDLGNVGICADQDAGVLNLATKDEAGNIFLMGVWNAPWNSEVPHDRTWLQIPGRTYDGITLSCGRNRVMLAARGADGRTIWIAELRWLYPPPEGSPYGSPYEFPFEFLGWRRIDF